MLSGKRHILSYGKSSASCSPLNMSNSYVQAICIFVFFFNFFLYARNICVDYLGSAGMIIVHVLQEMALSHS